MPLQEIPVPGFNRRKFLATSALAGAGLVFASGTRALNAQSTKGGSAGGKLNVAVIGCGSQGAVLLESLVEIIKDTRRPIGVRLAAVCDIWDFRRTQTTRRLAGNGVEGVNGYADIDDMLAKEKDLDAVFVATPDFWHAPHTNQCLKAGIHVYCEKMMSNTIDGARSMVRAMKETGKLLQIGHQRRSNPNYRFAVEKLIREKKILGRITNANAQWNRAVKADDVMPKKYRLSPDILKKYGYDDAHQFMNWRWFKKYSGGPISDLGAHQIDIFNWVFGRPKSVIAAGGVDYYKSHEWYDNVMCIFAYDTPEGVSRAYYQVLTTTSSGGGYFENFMGDQGSLKLSEQPQHIKAYAEPNFKEMWGKYVDEMLLKRESAPAAKASSAVVDSRESAAPDAFDLNIGIGSKKIHQFHVENFLKSIKGEDKLTCDAAHAFEAEASIYRVNEAVSAEKMLHYTDADFAV